MAKKIRIVVALTTNDNDYQIEQAQSAEQAAARLGVTAEIIYADNDAISQSTQILKVVQASAENRPDAVVFEPVGGTALPQVARAAATAGIGWAVLNRDAAYLDELRKTSGVQQAVAFGNALHVSSTDAAELERAIAPFRRDPYEWRQIPSGLEDAFISLMEERSPDHGKTS